MCKLDFYKVITDIYYFYYWCCNYNNLFYNLKCPPLPRICLKYENYYLNIVFSLLISLVCYQVLFTVGDGANLNSRQFGFRDGDKKRDHKLCSDSLVHGELTKMKVIDFKGAFRQAFNHSSDSLKLL